MSNTLVSARISKAKKERAGDVLASIGATTSDLINSAFDYVIANKELPVAALVKQRDHAGFAAFVQESTLAVDWPDDSNGTFKELIANMRRADYENLD